MSKITNEEKQKAIQEAEKIIAEAKQKGLEGGALIVLRVSPVDTDTLGMVIQGDPASAISALGTALVAACDTAKLPLFRMIHLLLKNQEIKKGDENKTL